jgi:hypothetical protein
MTNDPDNASSTLPPDLIELGELCGCTHKQIKFAEGMLQGMNFTEAAFHAGYAGERDSAQLRSAGSGAARAKPVQALLALAESRGLGIPSAPGDVEELKRILWMHARSKDRQSSIKATTELRNLEEKERNAKEAESEHDMSATLNAIAEIVPALAVHLASKHSIEWHVDPSQSGAVEKARREIATAWLDEQRAKAETVNQ